MRQLFSVRCSLIEHDNKLRVGKHGACLNRIQQVLHILRNSGRIRISLTELPPSRIEKCRAELVFKHDMELINKYMGTLAAFPVERYTVQHGIRNNQMANRLQLLTQSVNVKHNHTLVQIDCAFMPENIQRACGKQLQRQRNILCLFLRLIEQHFTQR